MNPSGYQLTFKEFGQNSGLISELYKLYSQDPSLVGDEWGAFFNLYIQNILRLNGGTSHEKNFLENAATREHIVDGLSYENGAVLKYGEVSQYSTQGNRINDYTIPQIFVQHPNIETREKIIQSSLVSNFSPELQVKVYKLIDTFRAYGHLEANTNPLTQGIVHMPDTPELDVERYNFAEQDLEVEVLCDGLCGQREMKVADIITNLKKFYCDTVGYEYMHILSPEEREWLRERIEVRHKPQVSHDALLYRLKNLLEEEAFERELHKKYIGAKWFSLEGGESLLPMLETILEECGSYGVQEAVLGMAHRGRLSVLTHVFDLPLQDIIRQFEDKTYASVFGDGDVKYHLGATSEYTSRLGNKLTITLSSNPSHLEFVHPVVEGIVRVKQDVVYANNRKKVLPIVMHGDSAVIGQGIVPETLNFYKLSGYYTGGTIHIVINNQVGFTTTIDEARSSTYCTDFAKAIDAPIFHVNGDDVDELCRIAALAFEYRQEYGRDVVIDLICYRKYGHNENDDPSVTQPTMYTEIKSKKSIPIRYADQLIAKGACSEEYVQETIKRYLDHFEAEREKANALPLVSTKKEFVEAQAVTTSSPREKLYEVATTHEKFPSDFTPHPKLLQLYRKRVQAFEAGKGIDWGFAETFAFGSLLLDGVSIRLSGQDSKRGTFNHRHIVLDDYSTGTSVFSPLCILNEKKGLNVKCEVINSPLSEAGVLGFEYGYSLYSGQCIVLWEAQFGDFFNGAQVIIDQFIAASECKWDLRSGLVLLLPHGYEGMGPEHSSARLERFLQLCAGDNISVYNLTTAAQYFHFLRRQGLSEIKRPAVIMSPKSLLRFPDASSEIVEFTEGVFHPVLKQEVNIESSANKGKGSKRAVLCSGKVYYDLFTACKAKNVKNLVIYRLEQLYPLDTDYLQKEIETNNFKSIYWLQEEPRNQGAYSFIRCLFLDTFGFDIKYFGRSESASTATGSHEYHDKEQKAIIEEIIKNL
jgi:2-oxoglutarate dehydrogenase E1 component